MANKYTNLKVKVRTRDRLAKFGETGLSFDGLINKILDKLEGLDDED